MTKFWKKVAAELKEARRLHEPLNSAHEAAAVIMEEFEEYWEEVRKKPALRNKARMAEELVQLAAMAQRAAEDLHLIGEV